MRRLLLVVLVFSLVSFGLPTNYTKSQIEAFVKEVFADQADALVLQNPNRLTLIEGFLSRVEVRNSPEYTGKKFQLLSEVGLQKKYNINLTRDVVCDPATFNPLKYRFPMSSNKREIFRFDHTDYLIIIQPISNP